MHHLRGSGSLRSQLVSARWVPARALGSSALALALLAGCGSSRSSVERASTVRSADFVDTQSPAPSATTASNETTTRVLDTTASPTASPTTRPTSGPLAASEGMIDVTAQAGAPEALSPAARPVGQAMLIDAKVGDVNARPVFASAFLDTMGERLRAEAVKRPPDEWRAWARKEITDRLNQFIRDELLRAEAMQRLSPEQKLGFLAFMEMMRKDLFARTGGSQAAAREELMAERGINDDQWLREREKEELIRFQISAEVDPRVVVSTRDMRLTYEKYQDVFNPAPRALFRIIRIPKARVDADLAEVDKRLKAGEAFTEVAKSELNSFKRAEAGQVSDKPPEIKGAISEGTWFADGVRNNAARQLTPGNWIGPYRAGEDVEYLALDAIEVVQTSFYDSQMLIEDRLRSARREQELTRYVERLKQQASFTQVDEMAARLVEIAAERYLPAAGPQSGGGR